MRFKISGPLKQAIAESSLRQRELARLAGIDETHLSKYLRQPFGARVRQRILLIADVVGVAAESAVKSCPR